MQEYIPHTAEKRIVVLDGTAVEAQEKTLPADDHRGNMSQDAVMRLCDITTEEQTLVETVAGNLAKHGVNFAGIDLAYPYVFEVNLVNPGGLVERFEEGGAPTYLEPLMSRLIASATRDLVNL